MVVEQPKQEYFLPITKYTFYEGDEWHLKVLMELPCIEKVPAENF